MPAVDPRTREAKLAAGAIGAAGAAATALALRRLRQERAEDGTGGGPRAYRLRTEERVAFGLRRVARGRLDSAVERLRTDDLDEVEAVHDARKDLKKLRAVLRLVRPVADEDLLRRENERYRDAARLLSGTRDAQVRAETIAALAARFPNDPPPHGWSGVREALALNDEIAGLGELRERAAAQIEGGREALTTLGLPGSDAELLGRGLQRTYSRGRRRLRAAAAEPTDERLHDLRKRAKDLWYHLRLLAPACQPALDPLTARADRLGELLGDDHDLAVLSAWLEDGHGDLDRETRSHLQRLIGQRRLEMQIELFDCAETIYHEKPKAFARRILGLWQSATP
ncbi:MAG TPA: CHAD domain-containing protein [Solirubrobacterales bacterium]|nr:CHAD domain-containing protein [Solirubrobacterales bacterium]